MLNDNKNIINIFSKLTKDKTLCHAQVFIEELAIKIGLEEATALQKIHYFITKSKNIIDGSIWVYNTYEDWKKYFPYWSIGQIRRIFSSLEKQGLLISKKFNVKRSDHIKWYSIDYFKLLSLLDYDLLKSTDPFVEIDRSRFVEIDKSYIDKHLTTNLKIKNKNEERRSDLEKENTLMMKVNKMKREDLEKLDRSKDEEIMKQAFENHIVNDEVHKEAFRRDGWDMNLITPLFNNFKLKHFLGRDDQYYIDYLNSKRDYSNDSIVFIGLPIGVEKNCYNAALN